MTLIAAYKEYDIPILLGDVLITSGGSEFHCKKINKITPNFVIGWTGLKINAMSVIRQLFRTFGGKQVSMQDVENFLLNLDTSQFLGAENEIKLNMLGWVVDNNKKYCFGWYSALNNDEYKQLIFLDENEKGLFAGSGSKFFEGLLQDRANFNFHSPQLTPYSKAVGRVLNEICALTNAEYLAIDKSWRNGFGFAYEVLIYDGEEFNYLNNIMYFTLNIFTASDWKILNYEVLPILYRYRTYGNISLFQISNNGINNNETHQYYVGRGYDNDAKKHVEFITAVEGHLPILTPKSNYYCLTIRTINQNKCCVGMMTIFGNNNTFFRINYKNNYVIFSFSPTFHRLLKDSIEANKY